LILKGRSATAAFHPELHRIVPQHVLRRTTCCGTMPAGALYFPPQYGVVTDAFQNPAAA